jgi:hypothetical protein
MEKNNGKKQGKNDRQKKQKSCPQNGNFYRKKDKKYYKKILSFWGIISAFLPYQKNEYTVGRDREKDREREVERKRKRERNRETERRRERERERESEWLLQEYSSAGSFL